MRPTPTSNTIEMRRGAFETLSDAVDYAATGETGLNFYTSRGDLTAAVPYREFRERAIAAARRMITLGLKPGERVVLQADTTPEFLSYFVGCQYAGLIPAPVAIPVMFGEREEYIANLRRQLVDSGAVAAIGPDALVDLLEEARDGISMRFAGGDTAFSALPEGDPELVFAKGDDLAYLQYSSGSTRNPAGIEITHKALMANVKYIAEAGLEIKPGDRCTSWLPLYHDMGLVGFFLAVLGTQISCDYVATRDFARRPLTWLKLISDHGGTLSYSPSFGYDLCCRQAARASALNLDLSSWRAAGIGGDMIRPQILDSFADAFGPHGFSRKAFVPSYGLAEVTLAATFAPLDTGARTHSVRRADLEAGVVTPANGADTEETMRSFMLCGNILPAHEMELRGEDGKPVGADRVGRVYLKGPSLMRGYYGKPEETTRILSDDGWLDTGDLGYLKDGELVITGRAKDLILLNGRNVWPQDLEWAVETLPGLRRGDAAAFSVDAGPEDEKVILLIQCRKTDPAFREELMENAKGAMKQMGVSEAEIHLVSPRSLPQTSSGKLSRAKAKLKFLAGEYAAPRPSAPERAAAPEPDTAAAT